VYLLTSKGKNLVYVELWCIKYDVFYAANSLIWAMTALNKFRIQAVSALKEYEAVFILKVWKMYVERKLSAADHYFPTWRHRQPTGKAISTQWGDLSVR